MLSPNKPIIPNITLPLAFKTIPICVTLLIILTLGEPDLLDAIIKLVMSYAK